MSISLVSESEDSLSGGELPEVRLPRAPRPVLVARSSRPPSADKENLVDLTGHFPSRRLNGGDNDPCDDDVLVVLSGSSGRSVLEECVQAQRASPKMRKGKGVGKKTKEKMPATSHSDSTVELNYDDPDDIFDAIFPESSQQTCTTLSQSKPSSSSTSGLSDMGSHGSGLTHTRCTTSGFGSSQSESTDSSSKVVQSSGSTKRRPSGDRSKKKSFEVLSKEAKKQKLLEERAARRAHNEAQKLYKPGECMKHMCVEINPVLLASWYMSDVVRECSAAQARVLPSPEIAEPALVLWSRRPPQLFSSHREDCGRALLVMEASRAAELVSQRALAHHAKAVGGVAGTALTLVVFGVKDYFKTAGRRKHSSVPRMTEIELEMAFTDLLVSASTDAVVANTPSELALLIVHLTKAIAEQPFKKAKEACDEQADFFMRGEKRKCVAVEAAGRGLSRLWQQMVAVLPQSSLETARALCGQYPSPLLLYQECRTPEGASRLAALGVSRAALPGARVRRLGAEFSRRLATLMTSADGDRLLD